MIDARSHIALQAGYGPLTAPIGIALHHSAGRLVTGSEADELAHLRAIDRLHQSDQNIGLFGYHLAAFPSGRAYICANLDRQRAHVAGRNHQLVGIVAIGTFTDTMPGTAQMQAIAECINFAQDFFGRKLPTKGHNEWALPGQGTACAGKLNGYDWTPLPPPPNLTATELAHAGPFLYAAFFKQDRSLLHAYDAGRIEAALQWWKAGQ